MALAPREAGLHLWPHDSIGGVNERSELASRSSRRLDARPCDGDDPAAVRARRPARRARAGAGSSHATTPGLAGPPGDRPPDRRLQRLRPVGRLAPRRPPGPDLRAAPPPAPRRAAGRARRRRDGDDRRPVGPLVRAEPARPRRRSRRTSPRIRGQLERFLDFSPGAGGAVMVNNLDWLGELSLIDFLRDTGKHFTIPYMLAKDSVQVAARARPVVHRVQLHAPAGVRLRAPPPDDGRRAADGRRRPVGQHHGRPRADPADERGGGTPTAQDRPTAWPTSCCCRRPGRSSARARPATSVWLDPARTSPYAFYQYWLNTDDRDVGTYLRWFTELPARTDRGARGRRGRGARGAGRRSGRWRSTSRPGPTARTRRHAAIADSEAKFSTRRRSPTRPSLRVAVRVGRRVHLRRRRSLADGRGRPPGGGRACSPRAARRAG